MSEKIILKSYELNLSKIDEGYLCSPVIVNAENRGKAKVIMFQKIRYDGLILSWTENEDVTFLNMPIRRSKEHDIVEFEGSNIKRREIEGLLKDRETENEFNQILDNPKITHCYIRKGTYYRPNYCGYTDFQSRAGVYPKQDAINHCKGCRDLRVIPIDTIEHNNMILTEITDLQTRLIQ